MGHYIQCIIGSDKIIEQLANNWIHAKTVTLKNGLSLIPLNENLFDDMNELVNKGATPSHVQFGFLSTSVEQVLKEQSYSEKIGYLETEYFGGSGVQSAILYFKGEILSSPYTTLTVWNEKEHKYQDKPDGERPINRVLYNLGIEKRTDMDAFDVIGLGKYRSNEQLMKIANNG